MLGGIGRQDIQNKYIEKMTTGGSWTFLYVVVDSDAVNFKMMRCIISDAIQYKRLLVLFTPCFARAPCP